MERTPVSYFLDNHLEQEAEKSTYLLTYHGTDSLPKQTSQEAQTVPLAGGWGERRSSARLAEKTRKNQEQPKARKQSPYVYPTYRSTETSWLKNS
jgi:hypothetical protein